VSNQSASASRDGAQSRNSADSSAYATPTSSTSATSSSSSSSASGTAQNVGPMPPGFPGLPPMGVPPMAMPPGATPADLLPVDPCLPCHSRHFLNRRSQMVAGQGAGADQVTVLAFANQFCSLLNAIFFLLFHSLC